MSDLDVLRDNKNKAECMIHSVMLKMNDNTKIYALKLALKEICDSNPEFKARVDVFYHLGENAIDKTYANKMLEFKGVTWVLFFKKVKDKYDHPDIDRFYSEHPQFYTGYFDDIPIYDPPEIDKNDFKSYYDYYKGF